MTDLITTTVLVVGAGPVGLLTALELAHAGAPVVLAGPSSVELGIPALAAGLGRTAALFQPSLVPLMRAGVLAALGKQACPIASIRIVDATGGLFTAPTIAFAAAEIGLEELGRNIPLSLLTQALEAAVAREPRITRMPATIWAFRAGANHIEACLSDGRHVHASLVVAAEGRASPAREFAGIRSETWDYGQVALTAHVTHGSPHNGVSTELHRRGGPLTTVPLAGCTSSLVWVETPGFAAQIQALSDADFAQRLERETHGHLGPIVGVADRRAFPLMGLRAQALGRDRVALVGESAHVMPPIGAQGLNLSIRDSIDLGAVVGAALARGADVGDDACLQAYSRKRLRDVVTRVAGVDLFNRSLTSSFPMLPAARGVGLSILKAAPALRRSVMAAGLGLTQASPLALPVSEVGA